MDFLRERLVGSVDPYGLAATMALPVHLPFVPYYGSQTE